MQKKGRPKKANAIKAGELQKGLCRFSFIVEKKIVRKIRENAERENVSIKDYMNNIIESYFNNMAVKEPEPNTKVDKLQPLGLLAANQTREAKTKNEAKLLKSLNS